MVILLRTEVGSAGLEVVKRAGDRAEGDRLGREAGWLRRAAHPGVVELVAEAPGELRLRHHGTPLARLTPLPVDHSAAILRVVAETLADLHQIGVTHGRLRADHVVVDDRGRPRLCGLAGAADATDEARAADVADLGCLLDELLDGGADLPWSQLRGWRCGSQRRHGLRRLRAAASAARRTEPSRRPTARQLSAALRDALPKLTLPTEPRPPDVQGTAETFSDLRYRSGPADQGGWTDEDLALLAATVADDGDDDNVVPQAEADAEIGARATAAPEPSTLSEHAQTGRSGHRVDRRLLAAVAGLVLVGGVVVGSTIARTLRPFGSASLTHATPTPTEVGGGDRPAAPRPVCPVAAPAGPDVDDDGCPDPLTLDDRVASIGALRIELGRPGDLAVVADSDCDGVATPVLLRPSTGEVFVFHEWATEVAVAVPASEVVPGAAAIAAAAGTCPAVTVTGEGIHHVVAGGDT